MHKSQKNMHHLPSPQAAALLRKLVKLAQSLLSPGQKSRIALGLAVGSELVDQRSSWLEAWLRRGKWASWLRWGVDFPSLGSLLTLLRVRELRGSD